MIREITFVKNNAERWKLIDDQLSQTENLSANEMADLYVQLTDDLSYARTFYPNSNTSLYLNQLAARTHRSIYKNKKEEKSRLITFFTREVPMAAYQSRKEILLSLSVFLIATFIGMISQAFNPDYARIIMGDAYVNSTLDNIENKDPMGIYNSDEEGSMFFRISKNNINVALYTFLFGLLFSLGTIWFLFSNGVMFGAFQWFFIQKGLFWVSFSAIFIHGSLELSAIVIAGGAGIVLGNSILFPRTFTRRQSFAEAGKRGLKIFIGLIPVFCVAAFFESYVTRHYNHIPDILKAVVIIFSFTYVVWYFYLYPASLGIAEADLNIE